MNKLGIFCATLGAALFFQVATAHAQSDLRRKVLERKRQNQTEQRDTPTPRAPQPSPEERRQCEARERILDSNKNRLEAYRGELAGVNAEIAQLQQRLNELNQARSRIQATLSGLETRVSRDESTFKSQCQMSDTCGRYETIVVRLDSDSKQLENDAGTIRREISTTQNSVANLRRSIEPLRIEYDRLQCNNLVPGETQQRTIDRCAQIFSEWNRRQAELNRYNQTIPSLRNRYENILAQLSALDGRASSAETYLQQNCRSSRQLRTVEVVHRRRRNIVTVGNELQRLGDAINDLKNLQITVTVR